MAKINKTDSDSMDDAVLDILNELDAMDPDTESNAPPVDSDSLKASDYIRVTVTKDLLRATITILKPPAAINFQEQDLLNALKAYDVTFGIDQSKIQAFVKAPVFNQPVEVAAGIPGEDGENGRYEFLFQTQTDMKPKILPDGSVDYSSYDNFYIVETDSELVYYYPATMGTAGTGVNGITLPAKKGADLPKLKGKGFHTNEDATVYYADFEGKPEYNESSLTLTVSNVLEIETDVTHATGNVLFSGDIHIRGSVYTGTTIQTNGNIIVDGHVEGAHLIAGKDVTLKGGMQGSGRGIIESGGSVQGKFFEQVRISCRQGLMANSILNCTIRCYDTVNVNGRLGIIVGGSIFALKGIRATMIGNMAEVRTVVSVGMDEELNRKKINCERAYTKSFEEFQKIESGVSQLKELVARTNRQDLKEKMMLLFRAKVAKGSEMKQLEEKKTEYDEMAEQSLNSRIAVSKGIFPRVTLSINSVSMTLTSQNYNVTYKLSEGEISTVPTG